MPREIKNVAASVRQQLLNRAHATNRPFNELLQHFAMERFLYRLAKSPHADRFVLKGALMMLLWKVPMSRPTMDIDLLGYVDNDIGTLVDMCKAVCRQPVEADGMVFDPATVEGGRIAEDAEYHGVRVRFRANLGTARVPHDIPAPRQRDPRRAGGSEYRVRAGRAEAQAVAGIRPQEPHRRCSRRLRRGRSMCEGVPETSGRGLGRRSGVRQLLGGARTLATSSRRVAEPGLAMSGERERLEAELRQEQARLAQLAREQAVVRERVDRLRVDLARLPGAELPPIVSAEAAGNMTPAGKIALFRRLFRGRDDVYPRLWINAKKDKRGYSPACANDFVRGICEKPRVKCGECPNQAFLPVDDDVVRDHLQGRHVIGVYPLLADETCWLLAVDFDKDGWQDDVAAFKETCATIGVPVAVERSRSGNGAHAWFFFESPVPAGTARRMGCYLITETMARRHELRLSSYDRLFPNQDTMPRGSFGNLIALPLQHEARRAGNTLFVDDRWDPIPDQWMLLAAHPRIAASRVDELARHAAAQGRVIGACVVHADSEDESEPWRRPVARRDRFPRIDCQLSGSVRAVIAQQVFVEKARLPSPMLNQIKRLATFSNPEFYKKQAMRLSTATAPRLIGCAEETSDHIGLPRGCRQDLEDLLRHYGVELVVEDKRQPGADLVAEFRGELTAEQQAAARALLDEEIGVFVAPPGSGKTVVGAHVSLLASAARWCWSIATSCSTSGGINSLRSWASTCDTSGRSEAASEG